MKTFIFFVERGYIMLNRDRGLDKNTAFRAHNDKKHAKKAADLKMVDDMQRLAGNEWSAPYHAALKAFMAFGYNSSVAYIVDDGLNVRISSTNEIAA